MLHFKAPIQWPEVIPVTALMQQRGDHGFSPSLSLDDAVRFLDEELTSVGIAYATLYTDVDQINSERMRKKLGSRTGACLHIKYADRGYILTCDKWQRLEHNIYAMHLVLRQWGNMVRWGVGSMAALLSGFEVDKAPIHYTHSGNQKDVSECFLAFGLGETATIDDATAIYYRRAKNYANDREKLTELNLQMDEIRQHFSNLKDRVDDE